MVKTKRRYRWKRIAILVAALIFGTVFLPSCWDTFFSEPRYIEYHKVVSENETLWDICSKVNQDREDVRKVVYRAMQDNHISDAGQIQPGQKLIIRVKEAR